MRILCVVNWLNRGGIEVTRLRLLPRLIREGIHTDFCCLGPGVLDADFAALGCAIRRIPKSPNCCRTATDIQRILAERDYALVHSHLGHVSGGFALGAARTGVPVVVSLHSAMPMALYHWRKLPLLAQVRKVWLRWHRYLMDKHVQVFVGHSKENLRAFAPHWERNPARYRVITNGAEFPTELPCRSEARRRLGLDDGVLVLLHVGNFSAPKNHLGLLSILEEVVRQRPAAVLLLVGDGPLRPEVARQCRKSGLERHVRCEGLQSDCWPYYAAADVFVFPSVTEGFGNVLVESQGAGLPVVASDIPAHHESVAPQQQRFLFPLPNYAAAANLILEQAEAAKAGRNPWVATAQRHVRDRLSIERMAREITQLYLELAPPDDRHRSSRALRARTEARGCAGVARS